MKSEFITTSSMPSRKSNLNFNREYCRGLASLNFAKNDNERLNIVNNIIRIIQNDIKYETLADFIYGEDFLERTKWAGLPLIPLQYKNEDGKIIDILSIKEEHTFDLNKDFVVARFTDIAKLSNIKSEPFIFDETEHQAEYYQGIDMCLVLEGKHHVAKAITDQRGGNIISKTTIPIDKLFNKISTDGVNWYYNDGCVIVPVIDFRYAVLFTACEIRHNLKEKMG